MAKSLPYKTFQTTHPEYDPQTWARCRTLCGAYGSKPSRWNRKVLSEVFPRHNFEAESVYEERVRRAFYVNYPGSVIDLIVAGLFEEQPTMEAEPQADPWYAEWFADVSKPGGQVTSFNDLLKSQILTALQTKRAWTLIELPSLGEAMPDNLAQQEASGALDAYACAIEPECVRDWERDEDGALSWALLAFQRSKRQTITDDRNMVEEEFVYYTTDGFEKYAITYDRDKSPRENDPVPLVAEGRHSFGRVPLCMLELTDGMWAMGKLEALAAAHLNTLAALNWATIKSLFPTPTAFLATEEAGSKITDDPNRAFNQKRSPAHVVTLGKDDRFEFVGPSSEPFAQAQTQCERLRDEMYRVVHAMAASVDNSAAALQRSGESKQADMNQTATVLKWLGEQIHKHAVEVLGLCGAGRKDPDYNWVMHGMEEFGAVDIDAMLKEAQAVDALSIPSATFQRMYKYKVAKQVLGDDADGKALDQICDELEEAITPEMYTMAQIGAEAAKDQAKPEDDAEEDPEEEMLR